MPKTIVLNNEMMVIKTQNDLNKEYSEEVHRLFNMWQEATVLLEDQPEKVAEARSNYKNILVKRDEEIRYYYTLYLESQQQGVTVNE